MAFTIRCPRCERQISYITRKTGEGICQTCGNVISRDELERLIQQQEKEQEKT